MIEGVHGRRRCVPPTVQDKVYNKSQVSAAIRQQARIQDFLQGGVNDGRVLRAPLASAPTGGLGLINIRLRYIASIEYSERFFLIFFFWLVKKFVEKQNWWSRAGGGHDPQNPPPGSAPGQS